MFTSAYRASLAPLGGAFAAQLASKGGAGATLAAFLSRYGGDAFPNASYDGFAAIGAGLAATVSLRAASWVPLVPRDDAERFTSYARDSLGVQWAGCEDDFALCGYASAEALAVGRGAVAAQVERGPFNLPSSPPPTPPHAPPPSCAADAVPYLAVVLQQAPLRGNEHSIMLNLASEAVRAASLETAIATRAAAATGWIFLVQEPSRLATLHNTPVVARGRAGGAGGAGDIVGFASIVFNVRAAPPRLCRSTFVPSVPLLSLLSFFQVSSHSHHSPRVPIAQWDSVVVQSLPTFRGEVDVVLSSTLSPGVRHTLRVRPRGAPAGGCAPPAARPHDRTAHGDDNNGGGHAAASSAAVSSPSPSASVVDDAPHVTYLPGDAHSAECTALGVSASARLGGATWRVAVYPTSSHLRCASASSEPAKRTAFVAVFVGVACGVLALSERLSRARDASREAVSRAALAVLEDVFPRKVAQKMVARAMRWGGGGAAAAPSAVAAAQLLSLQQHQRAHSADLVSPPPSCASPSATAAAKAASAAAATAAAADDAASLLGLDDRLLRAAVGGDGARNSDGRGGASPLPLPSARRSASAPLPSCVLPPDGALPFAPPPEFPMTRTASMLAGLGGLLWPAPPAAAAAGAGAASRPASFNEGGGGGSAGSPSARLSAARSTAGASIADGDDDDDTARGIGGCTTPALCCVVSAAHSAPTAPPHRLRTPSPPRRSSFRTARGGHGNQ